MLIVDYRKQGHLYTFRVPVGETTLQLVYDSLVSFIENDELNFDEQDAEVIYDILCSQVIHQQMNIPDPMKARTSFNGN